MNVDQSIKSKLSQIIYSENKAVIMLDHPGNRSNAFDMLIEERLLQFCHSLWILIAINTPKWNCCAVNMANVLHACSMVSQKAAQK